MNERTYSATPVKPGMALRSSPSEAGQALAEVNVGDLLDLVGDTQAGLAALGKAGQWVQVRSRRLGVYGWAPAAALSEAAGAAPGRAPELFREASPAIKPAPPEKPEAATKSPVATPPAGAGEPVFVRTPDADGINIRQGPAADYARAGRARQNERLRLLGDPAQYLPKLGKQNEWAPVEKASGEKGWAAAQYLERAPKYITPMYGHALPGIHGPADPGKWPWDGEAFQMINEARLSAAKVLAWGDMDGEIVAQLKRHNVKFVMARLFGKFPARRTVDSFIEEVHPSMKWLYDAGVRHFEVHNEPNLHHEDGPEGMWVQWQNGKEFGDFLVEVIQKLRPKYPDALFGWPGLSPGLDVNDAHGRRLRYDSARFLDEGDFAAKACDFICLHTYWGHDDFTRSIGEIKAYCERYPDKEIVVSEFSNSLDGPSKEFKGEQYAQFLVAAKAQCPGNLAGLFGYVMSASWGFTPETWRGSPIAHKVGQRSGD